MVPAPAKDWPIDAGAPVEFEDYSRAGDYVVWFKPGRNAGALRLRECASDESRVNADVIIRAPMRLRARRAAEEIDQRLIRLMPEAFTLPPNGLPSRGGSSPRISRRAHSGSLPERPVVSSDI